MLNAHPALPCPALPSRVAMQALSQWMSERAVLPIENSLGGSIHAVYDLLIRYRLHIVGETSLAINHCLVALPGSSKGDLKRVMSHPQVGARRVAHGVAHSGGVVGWNSTDNARIACTGSTPAPCMYVAIHNVFLHSLLPRPPRRSPSATATCGACPW